MCAPSDSPSASFARSHAEWELLRGLCSASLPAPARLRLSLALQGELFHSLEHRLAFAEIRALAQRAPAASPAQFRELLPARITARGFPDFPFDSLFNPETVPAAELEPRLEALAKELAANP